MIHSNNKPPVPPYIVRFIQVLCVVTVMKSMVASRNLRSVVGQGTFCTEKCMGGMGVGASSEWSPRMSARTGKFDFSTVEGN